MTIAVAAEVRALMGRRGVTQNELAGAIGKSQSYVSRRLTQVPEKPFDLDDIEAAAHLLGTSMAAIFAAAERDLPNVIQMSDRRGRITASPSEASPHAAYDSADGTSKDQTEHDFDI